MFSFANKTITNQKVDLPILNKKKIELFIKREDLIHTIISGNKFRKLKYNILELKKLRKRQIITFGGAFSNHLFACAYLGYTNKIKTVGIIRGEELEFEELNYNLKQCQKFGMELKFISRNEYKERNNLRYQKYLLNKFDRSYLIPEGGTNDLGVLGCQEILNENDKYFDSICCPVGSGGTISGLINESKETQIVIGFSALKSSGVEKVINGFVTKKNWKIYQDDLFGGYSKIDEKLVSFINDFFRNYKILLDPIYNSKMLYKIISLINNNNHDFGKKILMINTGGLHSIKGINQKLSKKGCSIINQ